MSEAFTTEKASQLKRAIRAAMDGLSNAPILHISNAF
jgi:hypothetical protein